MMSQLRTPQSQNDHEDQLQRLRVMHRLERLSLVIIALYIGTLIVLILPFPLCRLSSRNGCVLITRSRSLYVLLDDIFSIFMLTFLSETQAPHTKAKRIADRDYQARAV